MGGERKEMKLPAAAPGGSESEDKPPPINPKQYLADLAKELHKPQRHKYPTRKVFAPSKDNTWGIDLADMSTWKAENDGYTFIVLAIDVYTRWAAARALKTKTGAEVLAAIKDICKESKRMPRFLWVDEGTEFKNREVSAWRKANNIGMYHTYGRGKSVIVERLVRTMKTNMWKILTALNSHEWVGLLPTLIADYNNATHSTLGMSPNEASKHPEEAAKVWDKMRVEGKRQAKPTFKVGDVVRVSRTKGVFEKGFDVGWTRAEYTISRVDASRYPVVYHLIDYYKKPVAGSWYAQEIQKVKNPGIYLVDRILQKKGEMVKVRWLGWGPEYDSWEPASAMVDV